MEKEKSKKAVSCLLKGILIFFAVIALLYGGFIFIITYNPHYTRFTKNRKAEMEEKFSITITDNIKLRKYKDSSFLAQLDYTLYLYADDLETFMTENINGTVTEKYDNGNFRYERNHGKEVFVDVDKRDNKDYYSITLNISD